MIENKIKKLQWFHSSPASMMITNTAAVNVLVLKVARLSAMLMVYSISK